MTKRKQKRIHLIHLSDLVYASELGEDDGVFIMEKKYKGYCPEGRI